MATTIRCDIVSAEAQIFSGDVTMLIASAEEGEVGIAPRHAPLITRLKPGVVEAIKEDGSRESIYVSGGLLEVQPQVITILADTAIRAAELDAEAAETARNEARKALEDRGDSEDLATQQQRLAQAQAQLQALERLRRNLKH